jgi:hypothetical protein
MISFRFYFTVASISPRNALEGFGQVPAGAIYTRQVELFDAQSGISLNPYDIGSLDNGDWVKYSSLDFSAGVREFRAQIGVEAKIAGQALELRFASRFAGGAIHHRCASGRSCSRRCRPRLECWKYCAFYRRASRLMFRHS